LQQIYSQMAQEITPQQSSKSNLPPATGNLRVLQLRMLDIMIEIDRICRKYQLRYWISFGTLIGAVRHGGFIPWDDDMDICIYDEDYDRFLQVCPSELPDWLFLQTDKSDPHSNMGHGICKVRDRQSLFIQGFEDFGYPYVKGCFVDVFKAIDYPRVPRSVIHYLSRRIGLAHGFYHYNRRISFKNCFSYFVYPLSYVVHFAIFKALYILGRHYVYASPQQSGSGCVNDKDTIFPLSEISFEGHLFCCPNNPDGCLRQVYGDYMNVPAPEHRRTHALYFFADQTQGEVKY